MHVWIREFPEILIITKVTPIYNKANPFKKDNYTPISILSNISKIHERIIHELLIAKLNHGDIIIAYFILAYFTDRKRKT